MRNRQRILDGRGERMFRGVGQVRAVLLGGLDVQRWCVRDQFDELSGLPG